MTPWQGAVATFKKDLQVQIAEGNEQVSMHFIYNGLLAMEIDEEVIEGATAEQILLANVIIKSVKLAQTLTQEQLRVLLPYTDKLLDPQLSFKMSQQCAEDVFNAGFLN